MPFYDLATRAQVLALKCVGATNPTIQEQTGVPSRTINRIFDRAIDRGFDPMTQPCVILNRHVEDAPRWRRMTSTSSSRLSTASSESLAIHITRDAATPLSWETSSAADDTGATRSHGAPQRSGSASEEPEAQDYPSPCGSQEDMPSSSAAPSSPRFAATRCLQAQNLMFPIFGDTIDLKKLVVIVQAGDSLMRHDAVDFLRNRLPTWDGVWSQSCLPRPDRGDSLTAKFAKISRCITLLERRSHIDDIRLRLHRIFQYQLHLRCKKEVDSSGGKNSPGQRSA
ncbi:hypothetical protein NKR23_g12534, partial [Pleurostoma richardsiae]